MHSVEDISHELVIPAADVAPLRRHDVPRPIAPRRAVVVHAGARDAYQVALALSEHGALETLVTDLFWADDAHAATLANRLLPPAVASLLKRRSTPGLPSRRVTSLPLAGLAGLLLDRVRSLPFSLRQKITRSADAALGRAAGKRARRTGAGLVSYSYYGYHAFKAYGKGGTLFQMHPHPLTMRRILQRELELHPDCASSLSQEWELSLPEHDFSRLVEETELARTFLVASSFTRQSLVENGASPESICIVPYGVDLERFHPKAPGSPAPAAPLKLLFVGRINQRKGIRYLLEALKHFQPSEVTLTVCGRVVDGLTLFEPFGSQVTIRPNVSAAELVAAYQDADLFVFPSVGEGFGQVLLEALACGLPVLSTTHTAAPDLISDRLEGFIVEPRRPDLLADRIRWALTHRAELASMAVAARHRAEHFTWARFRDRVADAVAGFLHADALEELKEAAHV